MVRGIFAGAAVIVMIAGLASCGIDEAGPLAPDRPEARFVDAPDGASPETAGSRLTAPQAYLALELSQRFRFLAITFPSPSEVGVCHGQVAKRQRPVPFQLERVEVELPQEAWDQAGGEVALFQYVLFAPNGMILEAVRCRIPRSERARDLVIEYFSIQTEGKRLRGEGWSEAGGKEPGAAPGRTLGQLVAALDGGGGTCNEPDPPSHCLPCSDPENPLPCWDIDGVAIEVGCMYPDHERNEDGICACWNGSPEDDCYLEWEGEGDFCDEFPDHCPDGGDGGGGGGGGGGDGGGASALQDLVDGDPFALLGDTIPCALIPVWGTLVNHEVPDSVVNAVTSRYPGSSIQSILQATGGIWRGGVTNLDYYAVRVPVSAIPDGKTPLEYFEHMRSNFNDFVPVEFSYYDGSDGQEKDRWESQAPLGTVFSIDLQSLDAPWGTVNIVSASVFTSAHSDSTWTFSTARTAIDGSHPVSGVRQFGVANNGDGTVSYFTRAADRVSSMYWLTMNLNPFVSIFEEGGAVWEGFQENLAADLGSSAIIEPPVMYRPRWSTVDDVLKGEKPVSSLDGCSQL
jgi:hypothetical protein